MLAKATFGAGCFWGVEESLRNTRGVTQTAVGYAGGHTENPSYEQVCSGRTGHAEVVQVEFDPNVITYDQLLDKFFSIHDPTQQNGQGVDVGAQYRSLILFHNAEQKAEAERAIERMNSSGMFLSKVATELSPYDSFYRAEEYHQK